MIIATASAFMITTIDDIERAAEWRAITTISHAPCWHERHYFLHPHGISISADNII
jgi:hypothetical protein